MVIPEPKIVLAKVLPSLVGVMVIAWAAPVPKLRSATAPPKTKLIFFAN
jgi:hypothetical protein